MWGIVTVLLLSDMLSLLGEVIGLPPQYALVILASPTFLIGAIGWWMIVERRHAYSYFSGVVFGLVTALFTGVFWTVRFVDFWGLDMLMVPAVSYIVLFVLGIVMVVGAIVGLPIMYGRQRVQHGEEKASN